MAHGSDEPSDDEWNGLINVLREEIETSRRIEELVRNSIHRIFSRASASDSESV